MTCVRKTTKRVYSGILRKSIDAPLWLFRMIYGDEEAEQERRHVIDKERHTRLQALAEHFGLEGVDVHTEAGKMQVLWALAEEHVPGFKVKTGEGKKRKLGRPTYWQGPFGQMVLIMVQSIVYAEGLSERAACQRLFDSWKAGEKKQLDGAGNASVSVLGEMDFESFYSRYKELKKSEPWVEGGKENFEAFKRDNPLPTKARMVRKND